MTMPVFSDHDAHRGPCLRCGLSWKTCDRRTEGRCCDDCVEQYGATHPLITGDA